MQVYTSTMEYVDQNRCRELAKSSSFYRRIYSEVEEIGWEHLVKLGEDLRLLSFRMMDKKGRMHIVQITLDGTYPNHPPSISAVGILQISDTRALHSIGDAIIY